jgi:hypothetical protein
MKKETLCIKFFCRSFDLKLYRLSKGLYESWGFPCVRLTDQSADGYFYTMLKDAECDIAINVDEDCFITSKEAVMSLVEYVVDNGFANAGCPDGGSWVPRGGNPLVTNPFFNVFNLNLIREKFSKERIETFDYTSCRQEMEASYPQEFLYKDRRYSFDKSKYLEPYYPFFLWLAYNTKTLYLPNAGYPDGWTTVLYNHEGKELCRHTWLARFYSVPAFVVRHWQPTAGAQQERINHVIDEAYTIQNLQKPVFGWKDNMAFVGNKLIRWMIKIPQRIAGWPRKWRNKCSKRH